MSDPIITRAASGWFAESSSRTFFIDGNISSPEPRTTSTRLSPLNEIARTSSSSKDFLLIMFCVLISMT